MERQMCVAIRSVRLVAALAASTLVLSGWLSPAWGASAASFGLQAGGQIKTVIIAFLDADALQRFRESKGWKAGVDGSIAVVTLGAGGAIDTTKLKDPIVGFAVDQKGLMANLTFEGSKFTKLDKKT